MNSELVTEIEEKDIDSWEEENNSSSEESTVSKDLKSIRVIRTNQDYNLDNLMRSVKDNINLGPEYQRRSRWNITQKSRLIESFLMNIPVPSIFLYENDLYEYEVIDGRQRLEALQSFFDNKFKLKNLEFLHDLEGLKFNDFDRDTIRSLYRRTVTATILLVESETFDKYDLRMVLFNRLNTGGVKLNGQELRNAIYSGSFNSLILELSQNTYFKELWSIPDEVDRDKLKNNSLYKTMMDCELVLRFFGIKNVYESNVDGSMKAILDETMKQYLFSDEKKIDNLKKDFEETVEGLVNNIGVEVIINTKLDHPQRARNLYDSMMVAYSIVEKDKILGKCDILENLKAVLNVPDAYDKIITKGNSIENIIFRVNKAKEILTQILY